MSTDFSDIASSLASAGYGGDAASVLATCQTLLDVQDQASQQEFRDFRDAVGWHPKIFSKLLTIGKDERLFDYATDLPASYTAIYALASLSDEEFAAAGEEGVISTSSSVRFINDWVKARRLHGNAVVEEIALTLTVRRSRSAEEVDALLASLKSVADAAGASLRVGTGSVRKQSQESDRRPLSRSWSCWWVVWTLLSLRQTLHWWNSSALLRVRRWRRVKCASSRVFLSVPLDPLMRCGSTTARTTA